MSKNPQASIQVSERAGSLARRLLGGGGAASLDAYRVGACLPFVAHGMTAAGDLVIAAPRTGEIGPEGTDVRLDVVRQTGDPALAVIASSIHVLGALTWVDDAEARGMGGLPERVANLLTVPGMGLGLIAVKRAVLHDLHGASVIEPEEIFHEAQLDDHAGYDAVAACELSVLKDLCWSVMVGAIPGEVVSKAALPGVCAHTAERVHCVDVDSFGVTLMLAGQAETVLVFAAFPSAQGTPRERVDGLFSAVVVPA